MKTKIFLQSKRGSYSAEALFSEGTVTVLKGTKIQLDFAEHIVGGKKAKSYRDDRSFVDENGIVLKECIFTSPSTAAQFVTGRSTNGYGAWKLDKKTSLGKHLDREKSK